MTSKKIADSIFNIKEKLTDKEFKDIMDLLSIKNKEEDKVELYEFTYLKNKPKMDKMKLNNRKFGYNFDNFKTKTKIVTIGSNTVFCPNHLKNLIENENNMLQKQTFKITKEKDNNTDYPELLFGGYYGYCSSVNEKWCSNPYDRDEDSDYNDSNSDSDEDRKGVFIRYRKYIGLSLKKIKM